MIAVGCLWICGFVAAIRAASFTYFGDLLRCPHKRIVTITKVYMGKEGIYARDGLHLSGKGAAVFAEGLSGAVASGLGKVRYLN